MVSHYTLAKAIESLTLESGFKPFGERYPLDRRYKVWCMAGHGNAHHDTFYGVVGGIQFELHINYDDSYCKCRLLKRDEYFRSVPV